MKRRRRELLRRLRVALRVLRGRRVMNAPDSQFILSAPLDTRDLHA